MPRPAALADLLKGTLHGTPMEKRLKEGKIWLVWDTAVGRQIAGRARPVGFRDGTLTVAVNSSPWMQQLTFLKKGIMERLNSLLGEDLVREIYLKAGRPEQPRPEPVPVRLGKRPLSPADMQRISRSTAPVNDPDLRSLLEELLARHLESSGD